MLNFKIKKKVFLNCLATVQGASEKKGSLSIVSNLLIENIDNNFIKISATDLEISIITYCSAEIISKGKITVNSKKIYSIIKEFPENKITASDNTSDNLYIDFIENESGMVTINYRKTIFKLTTVPAIDYPTIIDFKSEDNFDIDLKILKTLISNVIFSTALNEDTKRNLTGVYFVLVNSNEKDYLRLVATDGHRLSLTQFKIDYMGEKNDGIYNLLKTGIIIPKKILTEILKLDKEGVVNILINLNNVIFEFKKQSDETNKNTKFISRLIEGKFPDYETIIPKDGYKTSIINTKKFYNSIKMVSLLAEEKSHSIELGFTENNLLVKAVNTNIGEASDEIEIDYKGEPMNIKLNSRYIMDFIVNISEDSVSTRFNTIYTPFVIEPHVENNDDKIMYTIGVFMPMRY
ncbi:DNA polymerase III subunit beta [Candidatus Acidulodesulfobacterium sp. H_13]|uniref:DNA polymerase III subunit beta n=1 Tax=Candidatus Acidulodesulfobacterium sp. H_13 TaxID=3395470 RepID=UPI003AF519AA